MLAIIYTLNLAKGIIMHSKLEDVVRTHELNLVDTLLSISPYPNIIPGPTLPSNTYRIV